MRVQRSAPGYWPHVHCRPNTEFRLTWRSLGHGQTARNFNLRLIIFDIRTECAGVIAGSWFAKPARRGEDLIAVGLLMLAGHVDLDQLDHWVRVGWERRRRIRTAKTRLTFVMAAPGSESGLGDGWRMEHGTDR